MLVEDIIKNDEGEVTHQLQHEFEITVLVKFKALTGGKNKADGEQLVWKYPEAVFLLAHNLSVVDVKEVNFIQSEMVKI